jgi:hypothetical protein
MGLYLTFLFGTILFPFTASVAAYTWEKTSFTENLIQSEMGRLVPHPTDPNKVFLPTVNIPDLLSGSVDPADGLWMSADRGQTWTTINDSVLLSTYNILDLAICPASPDVMYVGTIQEGIFKTVDGGQSWINVSDNFQFNGERFPNPKWGVMAVATDPTNPDQVYISVAQIGELDIFNLSPNHPGFFYSHDGGATWNENNVGLPPRYDSLLDGRSHTAVAGSIIVLPQTPKFVVIGMTDLEVNTALFFNKTAETRGRVFVNTASGTGSFFEKSSGLPTQIRQSPEIPGSLVRVSSSTMMLSNSNGAQLNVWASHIAFTFDISISTTLTVTRNKGLFFTQDGIWEERNNGLPYISSWTDNLSTPDNVVRYEDTYNMGSVAVGRDSAHRICLAGSNRCDMGDSLTNDTKVYASVNSGLPAWIKDWDEGLDESPTYGYTEANATFIVFNADMSCAFATVRWTDDEVTTPFKEDNGVYRLVIR